MFPGLTELHLIGCPIELIWIPKSKSNTSTPKTNLLTFLPKGISHVMSGIICCACSTLAISVLQFAPLQWQKGFNKNQEKNESQRMPSIVSPSTSLSPVKRCYGKQDPWRSVVADDRSGQPDKLSSTGYSKSDYDRAWSSQEWKSEVTGHDRSGQPDKASWSMVQQVRPHHRETLLDGDAQSVRYGGMLRDRLGQLDNINFQEVADSSNFVMGSVTQQNLCMK